MRDEKAGLEGQLGPAETNNLDGGSVTESVSGATDNGREFWVSIDPPVGVSRSEATQWRAWIYSTGSEALHRFDTDTVERGWMALGEIDRSLRFFGWVRSGEWQLGSGRGYVAFLSIDADALLESFAAGPSDV